MPANEYYDSTGAPSSESSLDSSVIRGEFNAIEEGFNKLPTLAGNASKLLSVNSGATAVEAVADEVAAARIGAESTANKGAEDGYPGLDGYDLSLPNALGTVVSKVTHSSLSARTYTFPDKSGTVAMVNDVSALSAAVDTDIADVQAEVDSNTSDIGELQTDVATLQSSVSAINQVPVGTICPWVGGYFTDDSNGGFTNVLANTVADANTLLNSDGWYVCDGALLNYPGSSIFGGAGRRLPNLTDDRFIMGDTVAGSTGGSNTMDHNHAVYDHTLTLDEIPTHDHGGVLIPDATGSIWHTTNSGSGFKYSYDGSTDEAGGGLGHNHGNTSAASNYENRPKFLACLYIMRVA